ncbi:Glu-tRNA(Gln) amidotransferase, subunit A [Campylobacter sp. RM5004]|uniref:Asp-tRNA(Asn)/Glu-tRNA(Gln) amidotransferase subunit GatA n=1 Tax=Campylobacter sp. RM5004 TaxID=1660078 RepID=UPI001EFB5029|nr:Asp-tRNA(Asn)/Glu-tRNA(Gln) amidotransferase subunit GatA [Campylobacter sp. RM5004]ULO01255.1 Glu-tRNA(Gln) amidotransferase, subunit A [Campylobacter sp. RM5004]
MITLEQALKLSDNELIELKKELNKLALENKHLGAYVEQLINTPLDDVDYLGVPVAIKDNIQVKGWSVTNGSKIMQGYVAPYDASVITNMKNKGFAPFGRCNMDEFAMGNTTKSSYYGKTLNPLNNSLVPGGSSGGSAAVVGAKIALAALGSDTGGSVRQPAAFCGCVGFKPSYGRVSRYGLASYSSSLDQVGVLTQNVKDASILYDAIAGYCKYDSTSANVDFVSTFDKLDANKKYKIAIIKNYIDSCSEDIKAKTYEAIEKLKAHGHSISEVNLADSKYDVAAYYIIACAEASANLSRYDGIRYGKRADDFKDLNELYVNTRSEGFGFEVRKRILLGTFVLSSGYIDAYYKKAQLVREVITRKYNEILSDNDLILMPVSPTLPKTFDAKSTSVESYLEDIFTISVNLAKLAGISVPVAKTDDNLNVSVQLVAKRFDELNLLNAALSLENAVK